MLLPPELRRYFRIKVNASQINKDDLITVATYGLVCYEELDVMKRTEQNTMKSVVTMPAIDERRPYGHHTEHMPHVASFCATGNNLQFLNDPTGSRRWMPFEVESIRDPRTHPFNHAGIFAQAYALYNKGFRYWLEGEEEDMQKTHNEDFESPDPVREAIEEHFRKPGLDEVGEYLSATQILKVISDHPVMRFSTEAIGVAMKKAGFEYKRTNGKRGYRVVAYKPYEMEANRRDLAEVAKKDEEAGSDSSDTIF
jgi:predicted P-loop ATPase